MCNNIINCDKHLCENSTAIVRLQDAFAKGGIGIRPYRSSSGFINRPYDRGRVYVDLPIIEAEKLIAALKEV